MEIFESTEKAIREASAKNIPLLVTTGYTWPYEVAANPDGAPEPGVWALKTFPSYKIKGHLQVFAIKDTTDAKMFLLHLPGDQTAAIAGDGVNFHLVNFK